MEAPLRIAYIMRGISGSGKSTIVSAIAKEERGRICSTDEYFTDNETGEYCFDQKRLAEYHDANYRDFKFFAVYQTPSLICDNTNSQLWQFARYITIAKKAGYVVRVVEVRQPPLEIAVERNTHGVPRDAILAMCKGWQKYPAQTRRRRKRTTLGRRLREVRRALVRKPPATLDNETLLVGGKPLWISDHMLEATDVWEQDRGAFHFSLDYHVGESYWPPFHPPLNDTRVIWGEDRGAPYYTILCVVPESDQPLYVAEYENGDHVVVYGFTEGKRYRAIGSVPKIRDGLPLYVARRGSWGYRVVWGNVEGKRYSGILPNPRPEIYEGKPLYIAVDANNQQFVVWGDMEAERFNHIPLPPQVVDGKLLYVGADSKPRNSISVTRYGSAYRTVAYYSPQRIVWGKQYSREYDNITELTHSAQTPYAVAWKNQKACLLTGTEEGKWYDAINSIAIADTVPAYVAAVDDGEMIVFGCREGRRYDWINHLTIAAGQPLAVAQSGVDRFVLWGKHEGPPHDWITSPPRLRHGQIHYRALEAGREYRIWCELT